MFGDIRKIIPVQFSQVFFFYILISDVFILVYVVYTCICILYTVYNAGNHVPL